MKFHFDHIVNTHAVHPPAPGAVADWSSVAGLQQRMIEAVQELEAMADEVGMARHIQTYDSDRRKKALARAMGPALAGGDSANKAEAEARASDTYAKEIAQLAKEHAAAEQTAARWDSLKLVWSTCQSLLAMQRETVRHL